MVRRMGLIASKLKSRVAGGKSAVGDFDCHLRLANLGGELAKGRAIFENKITLMLSAASMKLSIE